MTAYLEGIDGEYIGRRIPLGFNQLTIGRNPNSQLRLQATNISREHAVIYYTNGVYAINDRGSRLGTFVNNRIVKTAQLHDGDVIMLGASAFRFVQPVQSHSSPGQNPAQPMYAESPVQPTKKNGNFGIIFLAIVLAAVGIWGVLSFVNKSPEPDSVFDSMIDSEPNSMLDSESDSESPQNEDQPLIPTESPNTESVISADTLFTDDFESGIKADWEAQHGEWRMINGNMQAVSGYPAVISVGDQSWSDYVIEAKIGGLRNTVSIAYKFLETDPNLIFFGVRNTGNAAYYFGISHYKQMCTYEVNDEVVTQFYSEENYFTEEDDHIVKIIVNGDLFTFTLDGETICTFSDSSLQNGKMTISSYPGTGAEPSYPWLDEIMITEK